MFKIMVNPDNRAFCSISSDRTILRVVCLRVCCILSVIYIFFPKFAPRVVCGSYRFAFSFTKCLFGTCFFNNATDVCCVSVQP